MSTTDVIDDDEAEIIETGSVPGVSIEHEPQEVSVMVDTTEVPGKIGISIAEPPLPPEAETDLEQTVLGEVLLTIEGAEALISYIQEAIDVCRRKPQ